MPVAALALLALLALPPDPADAAPASRRCESAVAGGLVGCVGKVAALTGRCYRETGAPCPVDDPRVTRTLDKLERSVLARCPDTLTAQTAGYGLSVTPQAVAARAREACMGEPATLAARTFGGPHGALLAGAPGEQLACLDEAYTRIAKLVTDVAKLQSSCIRKAHRGGTCDTAALAAKVSTLQARALARVEAACPDLAATLKYPASDFVARGVAQAGCLTATGHGDGGPLDLGCGPRAAVPVPPRGQWVRVELDEATWGTRCGDGSPYAFWLRLAPEGSPLWRVATDMQGGGVCVFESDCTSVPPELFQADEGQPDGGYLSTDPAVNPFHDWTMLFMPYCTQDVHIGGGATTAFPGGLQVHRFGALNARAALRWLRDVLWAALEAEDPEGWRPDRLRVMFAGESAGAFGVEYNYHYPLDELRWANTTGFPDSGLALDNGGLLSVRNLGLVVGPPTGPLAWNANAMLPSYCLAGDCAVGPVIQRATAPRLLGTPWQQILNISNQVDSTQVSTTFFSGIPAWTNALRSAYCDERDEPGLFWFLPAESGSIHTMLRSDSRFTTLAADGVVVRDWVAAAMNDPASVTDRVDEGTLTVDRPGVLPFPCTLGGP